MNLVLITAAAFGAEPSLAQARLELQRGFVDDALAELERWLLTEDGRIDPEAWWLKSQLLFDRADWPAARGAADRAFVHARTEEEAEVLGDWLRFLDQEFAVLTLRGPWGSDRARVELEPVKPPRDPDLARYQAALLRSLDEPLRLPIRVGLPAGAWRIDGQELVLVGGGAFEHALPPSPAARWRAARIEVGLGGGWSPRASNGLGPQPAVGLGIDLPIAAGRLGARVDWRPAFLRVEGLNTAFDPWGGALNLRWSWETAGAWRLGGGPLLSVGQSAEAGLWCRPSGESARCGDPPGAFVAFPRLPRLEAGGVLRVLALGEREIGGLGLSLEGSVGPRLAVGGLTTRPEASAAEQPYQLEQPPPLGMTLRLGLDAILPAPGARHRKAGT